MTEMDAGSTRKAWEIVQGLRALADFFELRPQLVPPNATVDCKYPSYAARWEKCWRGELGKDFDEAEWFRTVCKMVGSGEKKSLYGGVSLLRTFSPNVSFSVSISHEEFCEKRVIGTKKVSRPDPSAPLIEVEEEIVEWKCPDSFLT